MESHKRGQFTMWPESELGLLHMSYTPPGEVWELDIDVKDAPDLIALLEEMLDKELPSSGIVAEPITDIDNLKNRIAEARKTAILNDLVARRERNDLNSQIETLRHMALSRLDILERVFRAIRPRSLETQIAAVRQAYKSLARRIKALES